MNEPNEPNEPRETMLSERERETLMLMSRGNDLIQDVADEMGVDRSTADTYVRRSREKYRKCKNTVQFVEMMIGVPGGGGDDDS